MRGKKNSSSMNTSFKDQQPFRPTTTAAADGFPPSACKFPLRLPGT